MEDQFALDAEFKAAGRIALLGMGADPGTTNVYAAYAAKHLLDAVTELRVRDGDNSVCQGHDGFVAAFSPWVFIDECLCKAVSFRDGRYHLEEPLTGFEPFDFPELGVLNCYYVDHEESQTLPRFFPPARMVDFKLCMDDVTVETLRVMKRLGLSGKDRVRVGRRLGRAAGRRRVAAARPQGPGGTDAGQDLRRHAGAGTQERRAAGLLHLQRGRPRDRLRRAGRAGDGVSDRHSAGHRRAADHEGRWAGPGVRSPEEFDPDPFLERLAREGMPWHVRDDTARASCPGCASGRRGRPWRRSVRLAWASHPEAQRRGMSPKHGHLSRALRVTPWPPCLRDRLARDRSTDRPEEQ